MRKPFPSDITREQFSMIKQDLEGATKTTKPRTVDLYDVFCAILYRLKTGCQWRALLHDFPSFRLPHDFPSFRLVFYYYGIWRKNNDKGESILDYCLAKLIDLNRYEARENPVPMTLIIDSKTIQNADTAEEKGYDGGKKIWCEVTYSC